MPQEKNTFVADDANPILLTPAAIAMVKEAIKEDGQVGDGLRVAVAGGGCSGYQYSLDFEQKKRDEDVILEYDGLTVYIDPISAFYLRGTIIDYVSNEEDSGFKFNNPNAHRRTCSGCSCG